MTDLNLSSPAVSHLSDLSVLHLQWGSLQGPHEAIAGLSSLVQGGRPCSQQWVRGMKGSASRPGHCALDVVFYHEPHGLLPTL